MKVVRLQDFFKKADKKGIDLRGCVIEGSKFTYKFKAITEDDRVEVFYGANLDYIGVLSRNMLVKGIVLTPLSGLKNLGKNSYITVRCGT